MPKRTDIKTVMIIGAGPIVIGQACEFDYSGTQACKALKEEGYRVVLVNSNPATIMTDPDLADATYIEPITPDIVERLERLDQRLDLPGARRFEANAIHRLAEQLAVLGLVDRLRRGPDHLDVVLLQHALLVQLHRGVQRGLAAEGG